jgi:hypothetical protein
MKWRTLQNEELLTNMARLLQWAEPVRDTRENGYKILVLKPRE